MIRITDATRLAATKLRTRKVRLVVTIVISGLLFSGLAAASQVSRGAFDSLAEFNKEGFGERYIISAFGTSAGEDVTTKPEIIDRTLAIQKDLVARKTAEAKRLKLPYDSKSEQSPIQEFDMPNGKGRNVNFDHPAAKQALAEYAKTHPQPGKPELQKISRPYGPIGMYESKGLPLGPDAPTLKVIKDGKESFDQQPQQSGPQQSGLDSFSQAWGAMSADLVKPFMLPDTSATVGKDGSIPVVAPYSAVEQLQKLKALPSTANPAERLERLRTVRAGADKITFEVCYRNKESTELISQAIGQQQEIDRNKGDKTYVRPALQYGLPDKPCAPAEVIRDVRTAADKAQAAKQEQFDRLFGKQAPTEQLLSFRVIGIAPDPPDFNASVVSSMISMIVSSNLGMGMATWYTPLEVTAKQPLLNGFFNATDATMPMGSMMGLTGSQYIEFDSAATAKRFIEEQSCQPNFSITTSDNAQDPFAECQKQGKVFGYMPFGSNSVALEAVKDGFSTGFMYAAMTVALIAGIIMIGTVGRIIADSRRETAVFRAIGAKQIDIVLVYLIYTLFLTLLIYAFALLAGFLIAQFVHGKYAAEFTIQSLVAYNAQDLSRTFNLYHFHVPDMLKLLGLSLVGGLLSAAFPLLRNMRRNPIRDMRDDT